MSIAISRQPSTNFDASDALLAAEGELRYASFMRRCLRCPAHCDLRFVSVQITHFSARENPAFKSTDCAQNVAPGVQTAIRARAKKCIAPGFAEPPESPLLRPQKFANC
jgi:hypothetical protein